MTRFTSRLFVSAAFAAGGFLAITTAHVGAEDLPPIPDAVPFAQAETDGAGADLSDWQETRLITCKTSNVIPTKSVFVPKAPVKTKAVVAVPPPKAAAKPAAKPVVPAKAAKK